MHQACFGYALATFTLGLNNVINNEMDCDETLMKLRTFLASFHQTTPVRVVPIVITCAETVMAQLRMQSDGTLALPQCDSSPSLLWVAT